jgi:hypothetical protein
MREIFVSALAVGAQAAAPALVAGLVAAVSGQLTDWFSRKPKKAGAAAAAPIGSPVYPSTPGFVTEAAVPGALPVPAPAQPQFFDTQTGSPLAPDGAMALAPSPAIPGDQLFAGLAYEVHAVMPGGTSMPVDPAGHEFRTGDRFVVFYRPTLPGRMDVFNINPAGVQTQIDSVQLGGGQLAQLGPYEFAAMKGDDRLRLVMMPCSTPELLMVTRDIINVASVPADAADAPTPVEPLPACTAPTRSGRTAATRDIRKVAVEGTTAFALDPVTPQERSAGQIDAREVTIVFRHR